MKRILHILITLLAYQPIQSQTIEVKDTLDVYLVRETTDGDFFHVIDGRLVSKKKFDKIETLDSIYRNSDALHFVRFRNLNGKIKCTYLDYGSERGGPFGEYYEYYDNGRIKVHGFYTMPVDSIAPNSEIDSTWTYYSRNGRVIGFKNYKNGLANGNWKYFDKKGRISIDKEFKDGFSNGKWVKYTYVDKTFSYGVPCNFYKGFSQSYVYKETFYDTELDKFENIYSHTTFLTVDKIEQAIDYDSSSNKFVYFKSGKFYLLRDGIIVCLKEYKNGELIKNIEYDFR